MFVFLFVCFNVYGLLQLDTGSAPTTDAIQQLRAKAGKDAGIAFANVDTPALVQAIDSVSGLALVRLSLHVCACVSMAACMWLRLCLCLCVCVRERACFCACLPVSVSVSVSWKEVEGLGSGDEQLLVPLPLCLMARTCPTVSGLC